MVASIRRLSSTIKNQIAGVVLYGNTRNAQENGKIPNFPTDRVETICALTDGVCYGTLTVTAGHLSYSDDGKYPRRDTIFLLSRGKRADMLQLVTLWISSLIALEMPECHTPRMQGRSVRCWRVTKLGQPTLLFGVLFRPYFVFSRVLQFVATTIFTVNRNVGSILPSYACCSLVSYY